MLAFYRSRAIFGLFAQQERLSGEFVGEISVGQHGLAVDGDVFYAGGMSVRRGECCVANVAWSAIVFGLNTTMSAQLPFRIDSKNLRTSVGELPQCPQSSVVTRCGM